MQTAPPPPPIATMRLCRRIIVLVSLFESSSAFGVGNVGPPRNFQQPNTLLGMYSENESDFSTPCDAAANLTHSMGDSSTGDEISLLEDVPRVNDSTSMEEVGQTTTSTTHPALVRLQRTLKTKQKAYQSYLVQKSTVLKLKPIYVRKGKIDTWKPQPIFDKETERLQKEIWEAEHNLKQTEANLSLVEDGRSVLYNSEAEAKLKKKQREVEDLIKKNDDISLQLQQLQEQFKEQLSRKDAAIELLEKSMGDLHSSVSKKQNELEETERLCIDITENNKNLSSELQSLQEESRRQILAKESEIDSLQSDKINLESMVKQNQKELERKESEMQPLAGKVRAAESLAGKLAIELKSHRVEMKSKDDAFLSLQKKFEDTKAELDLLKNQGGFFVSHSSLFTNMRS